jgi:hypothetical protein
MTQLPDAIPAEPDPQSGPIAAGLTGKHVCPFCGTIGDKPDRPCARCLLEDTPQARQSTRWRLGPWYVLQSRNPSAPGMKYTTLLALVRKGQITAKTIIRGPTTQQFWKFAGQVKGVSREFGVCWACGTVLHPTASSCSRCNKSQELPANPDVLLENENAEGKPLYVDISPKPVDTFKSGDGKRPGNAAPRPSAPMPSAAATMAVAAGLTPPELADDELKTRPDQRQSPEKILSPRDLAAAFSLQYNPKSDLPPRAPSAPQRAPSRHTGRLIAISMVVLLLAAGVVVMSLPALRTPTLAWLHQMAGAAQTTPADSVPTETFKISSTDRPDWAMKPPPSDPSLQTPVSQTPVPQSNAPTDNPTPPASPNQPVANNPTPAQAPVTPVDNPATPPVKPVASSQDLDALAMQLRANGLDAESKHDYAAAQYFYEQIEKLPRDHWPADTDQLLKAAQKMNQSASSDH